MILDKKNYNVFLGWLTIFTIIPFILLFVLSIFDGSGHLTIDNYRQLLCPLYIKMIFNSIVIASLITIFCSFIIIPLTYLITLQKHRNLWLALFLIPSWINLLLKVYAFIGILASDGIVNNVLSTTGIGAVDFLFDIKGLIIVSTYVFLPFMMLPVYNSIIKIPPNIIKAARDLGANEVTLFFKVIIPNIMQAIVSAVTLVFIPSLSIFMISRLITGNKVMTLGSVIEQQFLVTGNWNLGSSIAIVLIGIMISFSLIMNKLSTIQIRRRDET